jgi:membrane-associated phospholipid phosphatase
VTRLVVAAAFLLATAAPARAQIEEDPGFEVSWAVDGVITGAGLGAALLATLIRVDQSRTWQSELVGFDMGVRSKFSASAAQISDMLVTLTILAPPLAHLGQGLDETYGKRTLLYGETLGVSLALNAIVKYAVQRPRPYTYSKDPRVAAYTKQQGPDSRVSFYSGHAALSFTAAVAGSTLFALSTDSKPARAVMWGVELTMASMTANLRVVAGKHFYSDILIGALMGTAVGVIVPALHATDRGVYRPSALELGVAGGGIVLGTTLAHVLPWKRDIVISLDRTIVRGAVVPLAVPSGGGLGLAGTF